MARYGEFVLLRPPFSWRTVLLWLAPSCTHAAGCGSAHRRRAAALRRAAARSGAAAPLSADEEEKLRAILAETRPSALRRDSSAAGRRAFPSSGSCPSRAALAARDVQQRLRRQPVTGMCGGPLEDFDRRSRIRAEAAVARADIETPRGQPHPAMRGHRGVGERVGGYEGGERCREGRAR